MAGIGFELKKIMDKDEKYISLISMAIKSMVVSSGPWIVSISLLLLINYFVKRLVPEEVYIQFIAIIIYSFIFSMILASPFISIITRYLSDIIYKKEDDKIFPLLVSSMIVVGVSSFSFAFWYITSYTQLQVYIWNICYLFTALSILWLIMIFVSALKDYNFVTYSFFICMVISFLLLYFVMNENLFQLIQAFNIGIVLTIAVLIAKIKHDFESEKLFDFSFLFLYKYYVMFFSGMFLYLALWIDKILYWFSSYSQEVMQGFYFFPAYDFVVFIAYLSLIPTSGYFIVYVETIFYENQQKYLKAIEDKESLSTISIYASQLKKSFYSGLFKIAVFQFFVAVVYIVFIQYTFDEKNINLETIPLLRIAILAVSLQMILNVIITFLYYFDAQKEILFLAIIFLICNVSITLFMIDLPYEYVGYSYFFSVLIAIVIAYFIAIYKVNRVNYYTFIKSGA